MLSIALSTSMQWQVLIRPREWQYGAAAGVGGVGAEDGEACGEGGGRLDLPEATDAVGLQGRHPREVEPLVQRGVGEQQQHARAALPSRRALCGPRIETT